MAKCSDFKLFLNRKRKISKIIFYSVILFLLYSLFYICLRIFIKDPCFFSWLPLILLHPRNLGMVHLVSVILLSFVLEYFFNRISSVAITKHEFQQILQTKTIFLNSEFFHVKEIKIKKLRKKQIRGEIICEEGFNIKFFSSIGKQNFLLKNDYVKTTSAKEEVKKWLLNSLISFFISFILIIFWSWIGLIIIGGLGLTGW